MVQGSWRWLVPAVLLLAGCQKLSGGGAAIKEGSSVKIHYTLKVDNEVVDSSTGKEPLSYVQGQGQIIPGLEKRLAGLKAGEKRTLSVSPEEGYGVSDPKAVRKVPKSSFAQAGKVKVGDMVGGEAGGQRFQARVLDVGAQEITLDLNHPLAGKTLNFDIEVVEVGPAS